MHLRLLNKLKTYKLFDKRPRSNNEPDTDLHLPYRITAINACNNMIAVAAAAGHVTLYKFYSRDFDDNELGDIPLLEIPVNHETGPATDTDTTSSNCDASPQASPNRKTPDYRSCLRTKVGFRRQAGYQPELVCLLLWQRQLPQINSLCINNGAKGQHLLLIGTDESLICVDYSLRTILINIGMYFLLVFYI